MIKAHNLCKQFGTKMIFKNAGFSINNAGFYLLLGPSGCGKSTLLSMVAGLEDYLSGEIEIIGTPALIFQNNELLEELNIRDNLLLGGLPNDEYYEYLKILSIEDLLEQYPSELSSGQQQRVGILRTILSKPAIILCDEPTESLDIENTKVVIDLLKKISETTIVLIATHDAQLINTEADGILSIFDQQISVDFKLNKKKIIDAPTSLTRKRMNGLYRTIFRKYNRVLYGLLMVPILVLLLFMSFQIKWFTAPASTSANNANVIYIQKLDDTFDLQSLPLENPLSTRKILNFVSVKLLNRTFDINVYPITYNDSLKKLQSGVYLNQNAQTKLEDIEVGDLITLTYNLAGVNYDYETIVEGFIIDQDLATPLIYYDYDLMNAYLEKLPLYEFTQMTQLEYLENSGNLYEVSQAYEDQTSIHRITSDLSNASMKAPLFEERLYFVEQTTVFKHLYILFDLIALVLWTVLLKVYLSRRTKYKQKVFAILSTQNISSRSLNKRHFLSSIGIVMISLLIEVGLILMTRFILSTYDTSLLTYYLLMVIVCNGMLGLYFIFDFYRIKKTDFNQVLKNKER